MKTIMLVDMDAFYASVELRRRPELRDTPMWVGGSQRGVVLSANYPARAYGVRGGMSSAQARRLCPQAVSLPPDFDAYTEVSAGIVAILETFTAKVQSASIDEAYLDVTGALRPHLTAPMIGEWLRAMVRDEQGITCSVGIGPNRLVAKMAANSAKPDGLLEVPPEAVVGFLHPQPVANLVGVGESTANRLHQLGINTIGELANSSRTSLQRTIGPRAGALLIELAWGRDSSRVIAGPGERGVGCQETFARDTDDRDVVRAELLRVSVKVASRMRTAEVLGRTVTLSLRFADFTTASRSLTLPAPTDSTDEMHAAAMRLLARAWRSRLRVRRVRVRVTGLVHQDEVWLQPTLDEPERGWRDAERAADKAIRKFGPRAVRRAVLTRPGHP
ncbi:MAG TPA: DNA polymerase IV [Propionicimonas sp.]|nr:DNA polymerase IV [Propionicimonas sp.]HRA06051.1 DNA polymerase IV [Propionicimonas sp.]